MTANERFQKIAEFVLRRREETLAHRPELALSLEICDFLQSSSCLLNSEF